MKKVMKKVEKDITSLTKKHVIKIFEEDAIPTIKSMILDDYNLMLNDQVTDRKSRTQPERYMDVFTERLDEFEYIVMDDDSMSLVVPGMDNFDFSGRLRILKNIIEGTSGTYVEIDEVQYEQMYERPPRLLDPFDPTMRKKERMYLLRLTGDLRRRMREGRIPIVRYPFSNTPPIDIFERTNTFVEKELLNKSISDALSRAQREFTKTFKM